MLDAVTMFCSHAVGERVALQPHPFRIQIVALIGPDPRHAADRKLFVIVLPDQRQITAVDGGKVTAARQHVVLVAVEADALMRVQRRVVPVCFWVVGVVMRVSVFMGSVLSQ